MTIASVSGSSWNAASASVCVVPITGSPPMPTADEKPMSCNSYIIWYVRVPDLETRPIRPGPVMSAGMIPALDLPGEITPGQFGPMIRVLLPVAQACAQNAAVSCTGMPSVITTASPIPASIASSTADLANRGGTNTTVTSAPVADIASPTLLYTGRHMPDRTSAKSALTPPLPGVTPPTPLLPARLIP